MRRLAIPLALLIVTACTSAGGGPPQARTPATTAAPTATPTPTVDWGAAAARFAKIDTAMQNAVQKAWHYGDAITSLGQFKTYYKAVYAALSRYETNLRSGTYPPDTQADLRILLQRLSTAMTLSYDVPQCTTFGEAASYHQKFLAAWDAMGAASHVVGTDLGLTYGP